MRFRIMFAAIVAVLVSPLSIAAADDAAPKSVCLSMMSIDHTEIPDDYTILFYMHGHKVWKAALTDRCFGLKNNDRGFTYSPTMPGSNQICANFLTIKVNDTGARCFVGDITPYEPALKTQ